MSSTVPGYTTEGKFQKVRYEICKSNQVLICNGIPIDQESTHDIRVKTVYELTFEVYPDPQLQGMHTPSFNFLHINRRSRYEQYT